MNQKTYLLAASLLVAGAANAGELHVFTSDVAGFNTHSIWYDDGQEITVVDSQFTVRAAQALVADIEAKSKSPITRVIVTHPNSDKFNGLSVFHALRAESISSEKTAANIPEADEYKRGFWINVAKAFTAETYPPLEAVKSTFSDEETITLKSGETITLFELDQPGVSTDQTVVRIDATGDLAVGDLVHSNNHAWLEGGLVDGKPQPTLEGWKADLNQLLSIGTGKVYGGRGDFLPVAEAVEQQVAYLDKADEIVASYIASLGDKVSELSDPATQAAHYAAIQAEFVKAFPDYAFPDLIGYSVYGLVGQHLGQ